MLAQLTGVAPKTLGAAATVAHANTPKIVQRVRALYHPKLDAKNNGFARFTFWAVNRDRGCAGGGVVSDCSGIAQSDWAFTKISAGF